MSFLSRLFGGGAKEAAVTDPSAAKVVSEVEHKGFLIQATPFKEAGQFQTAGVIVKEVAGERKEHRFIRADRFPSLEEAASFAITKGTQIVDEQGEQAFL